MAQPTPPLSQQQQASAAGHRPALAASIDHYAVPPDAKQPPLVKGKESSTGSGLARFKSAAKKVVAESDSQPGSPSLSAKPKATLLAQVIRDSTANFKPVEHTYMTWLDVEKKLEREYITIQEKSFSMLMKRRFVTGEGDREAKHVGVNPFDDNRVILSRLPDEPSGTDSTFINASFLDGKHPKEYIACAMPQNPTTRADFWRMIYEQKVGMIIMLNDEHEQNGGQYWPPKKGEATTYGLITVTWVSQRVVNNNSDALIREFKVAGPDREMIVMHVQYKEWPDMGIPQEKDEFVAWFAEVDSMYEDLDSRNHGLTYVVHCFGGVGRTGTFLMVHSTIQKLKRLGGKALEMEKILALMRFKRANLVQTAEQYKFCYRVLLELYEGKRSLVTILTVLKPKD
jgi:protein tyrosine phosphatase